MTKYFSWFPILMVLVILTSCTSDEHSSRNKDFDGLLSKLSSPKEKKVISKQYVSHEEIQNVINQVAKCWAVSDGGKNITSSVSTELFMLIDKHRVVQKIEIVDKGKYKKEPAFRAFTDSAMKALKNPSCSPLNLPPEKYDQWHELTIVFEQKNMF